MMHGQKNIKLFPFRLLATQLNNSLYESLCACIYRQRWQKKVFFPINFIYEFLNSPLNNFFFGGGDFKFF